MLKHKFYTMSEVAKILHCSVEDIDKLIMGGLVRYVDRRPVLIDEEDLVAYLNSKKKKSDDRPREEIHPLVRITLSEAEIPHWKTRQRTKEQIIADAENLAKGKEICEAMYRLAHKKYPKSYVESLEKQVQALIDTPGSNMYSRARKAMNWWTSYKRRYLEDK